MEPQAPTALRGTAGVDQEPPAAWGDPAAGSGEPADHGWPWSQEEANAWAEAEQWVTLGLWEVQVAL